MAISKLQQISPHLSLTSVIPDPLPFAPLPATSPAKETAIRGPRMWINSDVDLRREEVGRLARINSIR
jgi:hypothetical protein